MKVALITHHFPPNFKAGAEQYAYRIAQGLRRQGHIVEVVCVESITEGTLAPTCTTDTYEGLSVHRLRFNIRLAPNSSEWSFRNPELGRWVKVFLQAFCPDVVQINSGYLLGGTVPEAAHELGLPTVLTLHDYWFLCPLHTLLRRDGRICEGPVPPARCVWCSLSEKRRYRLFDIHLKGRLGDAFVKLSQSEGIARTIGITSELELMAERRIYLKQVLETVDVVISPSRFLLQKVEDYGFKPRRVVYLPFGLEEALLSALPPRISAGKLRIGYLGQFAPHKGVHLLLAAFRKLATRPGTCELILHGITSDNSPYLRELLRLAKTDAAITFAGPYPNSEVGRVLSTLDVIAVPSVWYENRPSVIIEALANGTPVVAARLGGMAELIEHERNGLLFRAGSVEDLAQQLRRLVEDPLLLPKLRAGISPVKNLAQEIGELEEIYQGVAMTADIKSRISPR